MPKRKSIFSYRKSREITIGDLVYHLLYGKGWRGILLEFKKEETGLSSPRELALVYLQPNSEHEDYFSKTLTKYKIGSRMGYVYTHWLCKVERNK